MNCQMFKPLLRTIPSINGNMTLACELESIEKNDSNMFSAEIRHGRLIPLSAQTKILNIPVNMLKSSWEYDVKKFYAQYSDMFYNNETFLFDNKDFKKIQYGTSNLGRNKDFEMGVRRINYKSNGHQFLLYAPFWCEASDDLPDLLNIQMVFKIGNRKLEKNVNIYLNDKESNYITYYLKKYFDRIDSKVAYMDNSDMSITYWGINCENGGFAKKKDTTVKTLFNTKMPIQMFDKGVSGGFSRNRLIIKQIIPLSIYIDAVDFLNESERILYNNAEISFCFNYIKDSISIPFYDFSWDYDSYSEDILLMNKYNGVMSGSDGYQENLMSIGFPSFNENKLDKYLFSNKFEADFFRWKLRWSEDSDPYITNMSWAFSSNQNSNYKYKTFPASFTPQYGYAIMDENKYNLIFPLGKDIDVYDSYNELSSKKYQNIMNNYCLNWFDVVYDPTNIKTDDSIEWKSVDDNYAYYKGVLYNLNEIYNQLPDDVHKIDKFAMLVHPNVSNIDSNTSNKYKLADIILDYDNLSTNCSVNADIINDENIFDITGKYNCMVMFDKLFIDTDDVENSFVSLYDIGVDYYVKNTLYKLTDEGEAKLKFLRKWLNLDDKPGPNIDILLNELKIDWIDEETKSVWNISAVNNKLPKLMQSETFGYELYERIPIYKMSYLLNDENEFIQNIDNLYISISSNFNNFVKISELTPELLNNIIENAKTTCFTNLYDKYSFIDNNFFNDNAEMNIYEMMTVFCYDNDLYNIANIDEPGTPEHTLAMNVKQSYIDILTAYKNYFNETSVNQYSYCPVVEYNKQQIASNIVENKTNIYKTVVNTTIDKKDIDNKYLLVHPYNFAKIIERINKDFNVEYLPKYFVDTYAKVLNEEHLKWLASIDTSKIYTEIEEGMKHIFYKQTKVMVNDIDNKYLSTVFKYEKLDINDIENDKVRYDSKTDMFVDEDGNLFNIVEYAKYISVDKQIWEFINIESDLKYFDLFIYRGLNQYEYDEKYVGMFNIDVVQYDESMTLGNLNNVVYPCFTSEYVQERNKTLLFKNYSLDNIQRYFIKDADDYVVGYNLADFTALVNIKLAKSIIQSLNIDIDIDRLTKYKMLFNSDFAKFKIEESTDNRYDDFNLNTFYKDGELYGYYLIDVNVNNTTEFFNIFPINQIQNSNINTTDFVENIKQIYYINDVNIVENPKYIQTIFKQLCPFINIRLLKYFASLPTVIVPKAFSLTNVYSTIKSNDDTYKLKYTKQTITSAKKDILQRYTNMISPLLTNTDSVNQYMLKFKNVDATFNNKDMMYKTIVNIYRPEQIQIYDMNGNITSFYDDPEYLHYNNSKMFNLENEFDIVIPKTFTIEQLTDIENKMDDYKLSMYTEHIKKYIPDIDDKKIIFLYNRYDIITNIVVKSIINNIKFYQLSFKFILK